MSTKLKFSVGLALVVALVIGHWWWSRDRGPEGPLTLQGNVDIREVELGFRQPGRLARVAVDEGAAVKEGDVLAELDPQPFRDMVAAAEAEVALARAELDKLRNGNRSQEVAQAEASVHQAQAVADQSERDFARQSGLLAAGGASHKVVDAARSARDQANAALESARQGVSLLREGSRKEDISAGMARLAAATASLSQAQTALADSRIVAPANAVVATRVREPGSVVAANAPVLTLSLQDPIYVRAYVPELGLAKVSPGTSVTVRSDGSPKTFKGVIGFVSPRAEFTPKSVETTELRTDLVYRVRIVVSSGASALLQGMPVTVQVDGLDGKS